MLAYCKRLRSTHCRELPYLKLLLNHIFTVLVLNIFSFISEILLLCLIEDFLSIFLSFNRPVCLYVMIRGRHETFVRHLHTTFWGIEIVLLICTFAFQTANRKGNKIMHCVDFFLSGSFKDMGIYLSICYG